MNCGLGAINPSHCLLQLAPALLFFHGGGHVLGTLDGYDTFAQQLARLGNCVVLSVEYRLAPETKSTGIYQDGFDVYTWLLNSGEELGIDTGRIAIGGDSAGGNISIAVMLKCKQHKIAQPCYQVQIYPGIDYQMGYPSIEEFAEGYFLTKADKQWFRSQFLESEERASDPTVSSLLADLTGLPPGLVITAGFDPLRDEGEAFAKRLSDHGVEVEHVCYTDMIHAFVSFAGGIPAGMTALEKIGDAAATSASLAALGRLFVAKKRPNTRFGLTSKLKNSVDTIHSLPSTYIVAISCRR